MCAIAITSGLYFSRLSRHLITTQALERIDTIGETFAFNSEYGILVQDQDTLNKVVEGVLREKDIRLAIVLDANSRIANKVPNTLDEAALKHLRDVFLKRMNRGQAFTTELVGNLGDLHLRTYPVYSAAPQTIDEFDLFGIESAQQTLIGYCIMGYSPERIEHDIAQHQRVTYLILGIISGIILIVIFILSTLLVRHLHRLLLATRKVSEGNFSETIKIRSGDELEELATAFNSMTHDLKRTTVSRDALLTEVEEHKRTAAQLRDAKQQAEVANRAKSEFLASMSHEIRTPMNAIMGMADILWDSSLDEEQREYVRISRAAGNTLLNLIDDILDLSKVEAGELVLEEVEFDMDEMIRKTIEWLSIKAQEKKLELNYEKEEDLHTNVTGDPNRTRQILVNLIGNAIKFTDKGSITVCLSADSVKPTPGNFHISVQDSGIGIPEDKQRAIFGSFVQADSSTTRRYGGTGLGLTISTKLARKMGGQIWCESVIGQGSTFHFTIRLKAVPSEAPANADTLTRGPTTVTSLATDNRDILLVEDSDHNQAVIQAYLKGSAYSITIAEDGQAALDLFKQKVFGMVLMDLQMPIMDGYTATREMRQWESEEIKAGRRARVPIIALSASALPEDSKKSIAAGCEEHLPKPIMKSTLFALLERYLDRPPEA